MRFLFKILLPLLLLLCLISCGTEPQDTVPIITRPPVTERPEPEETEPPHEHEWEALASYRPYGKANAAGEIGYMAHHCTYEGCDKFRDELYRPALIALDFAGEEISFVDYLTEAVNVAPFAKNDTTYSFGTVKDGICDLSGAPRYEQIFINSELVLDELAEFRVSMDVMIGDGASKSTFFGFGRMSQNVASAFSFQLGLVDGQICYYKNFTASEENTWELSGRTFEAGHWYHFDIDINMEKQTVVIYAGEWTDGSRTELADYGYVGLCEGMAGLDAVERETVTFRISYDNGLAALDNFYVLLPEK